MWVSEICQRDVITAVADDTLVSAAERMRELHVGSLVIVDDGAAARARPVGVLTDRDIVVAVVARDADHITKLSVGDVMTADPVSVRTRDALDTALQRMRAYGVRRAPVVDDEGCLIGVIAVDDIVEYTCDVLTNVVEVMRRGRVREESRRT